VLGQHRSLVGPVRRSDVFANQGVPVEDADLILGLVHDELSIDERLVDGIPIGMQVDIALVVNDACHADVGYWNMQRQRAERGLLGRVQLDRFGANRPFRFRGGPLAPRPKLRVGIGLVGKRSSRVEVILDIMKWPFDAGRAIGVAQPVRTKDKSEAVGVHEELAARGIALAYTTLTGFCRRHGIGQSPKEAAGHYEFEPGQEMQHDTSPHDVVIGGIKRRMQCASLVLCYSRMDYAQLYPRWTRFWIKVFLTEALTYFRGACGQCMIDNSSVIVAGGTGEHAVMAPEMTAFAHEVAPALHVQGADGLFVRLGLFGPFDRRHLGAAQNEHAPYGVARNR
jgi:hypothetical protein